MFSDTMTQMDIELMLQINALVKFDESSESS